MLYSILPIFWGERFPSPPHDKVIQMDAVLKLAHIHKAFQDNPALVDVSFQLKRAEILAVLGPSGSGKTTLLEIIAGLIEPDQGTVSWEGKDLAGVPAYRRGFGLMFQDYALFPHKNTAENVGFGLEMGGWTPAEREQRIQGVLNLVGLPGFGARAIDTLSGGERQRVALARSLAHQPELLMLDEPLGSLDRTLRERLLDELREILKELDQTALYVTHDQVEAFLIADRVVILRGGAVVQIGPPAEIYQHPNSPFTARFLGLTNLVEGQAQPQGRKTLITSVLGEWQIDQHREGQITLLLRPDQVQINDEPGETELAWEGKVTQKKFSGQLFRMEISHQGRSFRFEFPASRTDLPDPGERVQITFDPRRSVQVLA